MIFIYLFVIAIVGMLIAVLIERKRTKKSVLQILKSSCSIDSVQFEKRLDSLQTGSNTFKKYLYSITHVSAKKAVRYNELAVKKIKYLVRKKLHSDTIKETPSEFISQIHSK
ncbi:MAG: hypothetical protein MRY57_02570 [Candidatus Pacebacteria bacterium]|nr:hypothetical protein [Candidatus Paceibacterota bacterium]